MTPIPTSPLRFQDAAAAILRDGAGRYLLQHRDDLSWIFYPNCWGLFGGAIEAGEDPATCLARELEEELAVQGIVAEPFMTYDFDCRPFGGGEGKRFVFEGTVPDALIPQLKLGEGQALGWFTGAEVLARPDLVPYDSFSLFLHVHQTRFRAPL